MKNRSLVLSLCAAAFATASAFTTISSPMAVAAYVEVKTSTNSDWHCIPTSINCTNTAQFPCVIDVTRDTPPGVVPTRGKTSQCEVLTHNTADAGDYDPTTIEITAVAPL